MAIWTSPQSYIERNSGLVPYTSMAMGIWVYISDYATYPIHVFSQGTATDTARDLVQITTSGRLMIYTSTFGFAIGPTTIPLQTWKHIGFQRSGNNRTAYIDGISDIVFNDATSFTKENEKVCGGYTLEMGVCTFGALKMWSTTVADMAGEMYGYQAAQTSGSHTVTRLETNTDIGNQVSSGVGWSAYGTINTVGGDPPYLNSGGGSSALRRRRRSFLGGSL